METGDDALTAAEIAELGVRGVPMTLSGVKRRAKAEGWPWRQRAGKGGGVEYPVTTLPDAVRAEVARRSKDSAVEAPVAAASTAVQTVATAPKDSLPAPAPAKPNPVPVPTGQTQAARAREDAKLHLCAAWDVFWSRHAATHAKTRAIHKFVGLFNAGEIPVAPEVSRGLETISYRTLQRALDARAKGDLEALAGKYGNRAGAGVWDTDLAHVRDFILAELARAPHRSAAGLRGLAEGRFGTDVDAIDPKTGEVIGSKPLPSVRHVQRLISRFKAANGQVWQSLKNPDAWKNKAMLALGDASAHVARLNQEWEIDASPTDVLTIEGCRYTVYCCIDIYSRRIVVLLTRTPRTEAVKLLLRKAMLKWGVPETVKTDNGSDFVSREAKRVFASLGIVHETSKPYCPWEKPHVERAIGTLNHCFFPALPGYTGHNVATRQAIREQKPFSERLGETERDAFSVELSADELAGLIDAWVDRKYEPVAHDGLILRDTKGGNVGGWLGRPDQPQAIVHRRSPADMAAEWAGPIKTIVDERALDLLLAPAAGDRTVTKKGIRVEGARFWDDALIPLAGTGETVDVFYHPEDMGQVYVYRADPWQFLCVAVNLERLGLKRADVAATARARQRKFIAQRRKELKGLSKPLTPRRAVEMVLRDQDDPDGSNVIRLQRAPSNAQQPPSSLHSTPQLAAAGDAARAHAPLQARDLTPAEQAAHARVREHLRASSGAVAQGNAHGGQASDPGVQAAPVPNGPRGRFKRALELQGRSEAGETLDEADARWLRSYQASPEYRAQMRMKQDFGGGAFGRAAG